MHSILLFMLPIDASVASYRCGFARVVLWWCCDGFGQQRSPRDGRTLAGLGLEKTFGFKTRLVGIVNFERN